MQITDDLWYKNAIIYSLDLETFMDGNGDGVGDFEGLVCPAGIFACTWVLIPFGWHHFNPHLIKTMGMTLKIITVLIHGMAQRRVCSLYAQGQKTGY